MSEIREGGEEKLKAELRNYRSVEVMEKVGPGRKGKPAEKSGRPVEPLKEDINIWKTGINRHHKPALIYALLYHAVISCCLRSSLKCPTMKCKICHKGVFRCNSTTFSEMQHF